MSVQTISRSSSLEAAATRYAGEHFIGETLTLFQAVVDRDLDGLLGIEDEDFAILDVNPAGNVAPVRSQPEWEPWFKRYFLMLDALGATNDIEISAYRALKTSELGYSVVEFRNTIEGGSLLARFDCIATIVWKNTEDGWKEARWHCSIIDRDVQGDQQLDLDHHSSKVGA